MKRLVILGMVLSVLLAGCAGGNGQDIFETAQFEEKQNNREHARQLYQEILTKYPKSPLAKQAEARLAALAGKP